jgi:hypothetical protein
VRSGPQRTALHAGAGIALAALVALAAPDRAIARGQPPLRLATLAAGLPGTYDNSEQVAQDLAHGVASPHLALVLRIAPAHALMISDTMYYVRESVADDPRRVLSQRMWKLTADPKRQGVVQSIYVFKDPRRWAAAAEQPELLISLTADDLEPLPGCDLLWTQTGELLRAVATAKECRSEALKEGMLLEQRLTLQGNELSLGAAEVTADGRIAAPALFDSDVDFYRFTRRAGKTTAPDARPPAPGP